MDKARWFANYPDSVPQEIDPNHYNSLIELLEESFEKYTDRTAYHNLGRDISFSELDGLSANFASYLTNELKLEKGDRVAIQMPNVLQYPVAMFGILRAGLIVVNTNPLYTPREMEHQFNDSGAKAVVILANFAHNLEEVLPNTSVEHIVVTEIGDLVGGLKGKIVNFVVKSIKKMVPKFNLPQAVKYNTALQKGAQHSFQSPKLDSEDLAFLQYTGGTTGVSKGAMLSHRNIVANMEQISAWMKPKLRERQETCVTALPLYHIFALTVNCLAMLKIGAKNVLITNPRDMKAFIKELKKHPFTVTTGVNTLFNGLLNQEDFKTVDFSQFKVSVGGGMAVQHSVAEEWQKVTGVALVEGYGLTETSPVLTANPVNDTEQIGTIGLPLPSTDVVIKDDEGNDVKQGEAGEICAKGPQVMRGYWQRPKETDDVFIDGWFRTGDIGVMEESGFFKIVDRKKEMINVSGFNVYPNEIEDVIASHAKVLEVAAIGVPDKKSTECVKVFIVKKDASLTEEEVIEHCKENLTGYKVPRYVEFKEDLPKSNIGKILRRILRDAELNKTT